MAKTTGFFHLVTPAPCHLVIAKRGKMLNFALVGCGGMANWHAQQLQKLDEVKVVALVDPVPERPADFRNRYFNQAEVYGSLQHLLDRPPASLDAVVLVTPHALHYSEAKLALERGINVLVEKPMVTSRAHAEELSRIVKQTGKKLGIAFQAPYTQEFQCLARMRADGSLGRISMVNGWLSQNWKQFSTNTWRQDPKMSGGGQLYDSGAHVLNAMMWLVDSPVVEVGCFYDKRDTAVDIDGVAIARFQNGAMASLAIGGSGVPWDTMIQVQTDRLVAKTGPHGGWLELNGPNGKKIYPQINIDDHPAAGTPHRNFVNALLGREELICPVRYGVLLSALMDALYESGQSGCMVKVEPVGE